MGMKAEGEGDDSATQSLNVMNMAGIFIFHGAVMGAVILVEVFLFFYNTTKKDKKEFKAEVQRNLSQMSLIIYRSTKNLESYSDSEGSTSSQEENSSVNQKHENKFAPRQVANDIDNLKKRFVTDLKELKDHLISDINARQSFGQPIQEGCKSS